MTADLHKGYDATLKTQAKELVKQYIEYDGSDRPEYVYTAYRDAKNGDPCEVTRYTYVTGTSRVEKRLESLGTWSSAYDI